MKTLGRTEQILIGEVAQIPLAAKVDSGAASSALHCSLIEPILSDKVLNVRFIALDDKHVGYTGKELVLPVTHIKKVKSSNGQVEHRYYVDLEVTLGSDTFVTSFSLTDRRNMKYPILIGRSLLNTRYLIDVSRQNLAE